MDHLTPSNSPPHKMSTPLGHQNNPINLDEDLDEIDRDILGLDGAYEEYNADWSVGDVDLFPDLVTKDAVPTETKDAIPPSEASKADKQSSLPPSSGWNEQAKLDITLQRMLKTRRSKSRLKAPAHMAQYYSSTKPIVTEPIVAPQQTVQSVRTAHRTRSSCPRCNANAHLVFLQTGYYRPLQCSSDCILGLGEDDQGTYINQMKRNFPGFENPRGYAVEHAYLTKKQINEIMDEDLELFAPRKKRNRNKVQDSSSSAETLKDEEEGEKRSSPSSPPNDFKEDEKGEERQVEDR